jgi:hypothetical protein
MNMTKRRLLIIAGALAIGAMIFGCNNFMVCGFQDDPVDWDTEIYHGCAYDGVLWNCRLWEEEWVSNKSPTNTLCCVKIEQNYLHSLAAVLSFGIWMPQRVTWQKNSDNPLKAKRMK